jgi:hypothetical protein
MPEREIMTGIGAVAVRCPRVRDRAGEAGGRIRFSSTILPPYARRSKSLEVLQMISCDLVMLDFHVSASWANARDRPWFCADGKPFAGTPRKDILDR